MRILGFNVAEAKFFTGKLCTPEGEVVYKAARRRANTLSLEGARQLVMHSPLLARLNSQLERDTTLLYIAKILQPSIEHDLLRIFAADAMAREEETKAQVIIRRPRLYNGELLLRSASTVNVHFYGATETLIAKMVVLQTLTGSAMRLLVWFLQGLRMGKSGRGSAGVLDMNPSLLILQEDDLSLDRSYRTQPHWLFPDDPTPAFHTFVLPTNKIYKTMCDTSDLLEKNIRLLAPNERTALRHPPSKLPIYSELRRKARECLLAMPGSKSPSEVSALGATWRLLIRAYTLACLCERLNIRVFMTCENYLVEADAIQIVAPSLKIRTVSYQYSNLPLPSTLLTTTADIMLTMSPAHHGLWNRFGISPGQFVDVGYPFDSSFKLVREWSRRLRQQMEGAGALFILCYFDESVQQDKFGCISSEDHHRELATLARLVLEDCRVGLVVKSQFTRNTPSRLYEGDHVLAQAAATGRYVELCHGVHRNIVFPAAASLVADVTIGHMTGATACLEAALAGQRSVMINAYPVMGENDHIYAQANVVFPSLNDALAAIQQYRAGAEGYRNLGDWSEILPQFDPYRDGNAGRRTRRLLETLMERPSAGRISDPSHLECAIVT